MPSEYIGECGSGYMPDDVKWIDYCLLAGINYLKYVLGEPPEGCSLQIMMNDHDLGGYPSIGVYWSFPTPEPSEYIGRAQDLLGTFNDAVAWKEIQTLPEYTEEEEDE